MWHEFITLLRTFKPLRLALITLVFIDMVLRPTPGGPYSFEGMRIVTDLLAPVMFPILFMLLLLDSIMAMVYRSDKTGDVRRRYLIIALFDVSLAVAFVFYWLPFFRALDF